MKQLLIILFSFLAYPTFCQYADLGSGSQKDKIWWFDWAGVNITNNSSKVFTTNDGLTVTATFSAVSGPVLFPSIMNTWSGAVLHLLYDFSNSAIKPAIYTPLNTSLASFTLTITATRNGVPTPFTFVAADAEASVTSEITTLQSSGGAWKTIDFFRNSSQTSNPLTGCNTTTVKISDTYGGSSATGQNPVVATDAPANGNLVINASLSETGVQGAMAVAFGIFAPVDRGDLPATYGLAQHKLNYSVVNPCNYQPPYPSLTPLQNIYLGNVPGDADGIQTLDDNAAGVDEDALTTFPAYNHSGSYSLTIPVVNTSGINAFLKGWLDYNRNGVFDVNESASATVSNNSNSITLTWSGLPATLSSGSVADFGLRLRISSDQNGIQSATGFASDGEVEDYLVSSTSFVPSVTSFSSSDTTCINSSFSITNTTSSATSYYWNFCSPNVGSTPSGSLINNPGSLSYPVFIDYGSENGNYYGFVVSNDPGGLVRLNFGNSLLNTPIATYLGTFGGAVSINGQGFQLVNNNGNWIGIFVGGEIASVGPRIVKLDFGNSLTNTPVATNWGNVGNLLDYPTDIYVFKEGTNWYGITDNYRGNNLTRFNFGTNFSGIPTAVNLASVGGLNYPSGFYPINDNGNWRVFVTNTGDNTISRIDFGNSLLNNPTGVNIGNAGGAFNFPRDLHIFNDCGTYTGYLLNANTSSLVKLSFSNLTAIPTTTILGNIGGMNTPHSLSRVFRVGSDVYLFAVNLNGNNLTRLKFSGCNNSSALSSTLQNPPAITFNAAGTYTITLNTDDGLPTQSSYCKQVTVLPPPTIASMANVNVCSGSSVVLNPTVSGATSYSWSPSTGLSNPNIQSPVATPSTTTQYTLTASNGYCSAQSTVTINLINGAPPDFSYTQNICSPKTIQFNNLTANTTSVFWDFGNSTTNSSSQSPTVNYSSYGNYNVKLRVQTTSGCLDSITKTIPVTVLQDSLIKVADTTICKGSSVQLSTFSALNFCWNNTVGLSNAYVSNPVATPTATTTYYFTSQSIGTNLVANGDFSGGNTGFQSDYVSMFPNTAEAQYWVGTNPNAWWFSFPPCGDHTTGTGNMMMVNGSSIVGQKVWQQTITVTPNTNYAFSLWVKSLHSLSPADLKFSINNNILGNNIQANANTCIWDQFFATWNSGNNTSAVITIVNNNTALAGNDFALDDISFAQVFIKQDSVKISVVDPPTLSVSPNLAICSGDTIPISANGATVYSWSPSTGLSNSSLSNPLASPSTTTKYIVNAYNVPGCSSKDSVTITVKPKPIIAKSKDTGFCAGGSSVPIFATAPGAVQYNWYPVTGLSSSSTSNIIANPASTTMYYVQVTGSNACKSTDSVKVSVLPVPTIDTRSDTTICRGIQTVLYTTSSGATTFSWFPTTGLSDPNIPNPIASPNSFTKYLITASNGICSVKDSVTLDVIPAPLISKSNDTTICNQGQAQLFATGGSSYNWSPATGLNNTTISNPIASPSLPTTYKVTVAGSNGCSSLDSIKVGWIPKPIFTITPLAVSICVGESTMLTATGANTYNWYAGTNIQSPSSASTSVNPLSTQQYNVAVHHNFCKLDDTLHSVVTVNSLPVVTVSKSNDIDCSNASATLTATGGSSYSWTPLQGISTPNSATPMVTPAITTTYIVKVTNSQGCSKTDSIKVLVAFNPVSGGYNMPDAFTPNGDGKNDCFGIRYWGAVLSFDFSVYDRWGVLVFHSADPSACWDGNYKGVPQATGTFVYQIRAKTACGEVYKKGTVVLMR